MRDILLDTCALLWMVEDDAIGEDARAAVDQVHQRDGTLWISPITAWEIGLLTARGRIALSAAPQDWFHRLLGQRGVGLCAMEAETLISASFLPGTPPRDPADRIILATARALGLTVLTRDRIMLAYANAGHVSAIAC